jgi:hypothetical protein
VRVRLTDGAPDEPDSSDWDALCAGNPSPQQLFVALFDRIARGLPDRGPTEVDEDDTHRAHTTWFGDARYGIKVTEIASVETTDFPMVCTWETFGLPGMAVVWRYALEYAGQLGHCAFRHRELMGDFDTAADQRRFTDVWREVIGKVPVFAPA